MVKLLCISKDVFKKLKAILNEFETEPKSASFKPKTTSQQKLLKKEPITGARSNDLNADGNKCMGSFEPSNILYTRYSSFWRLRNFKAWFKEQASYEDSRYLEAYKIEN